jgi:hypothetical protein
MVPQHIGNIDLVYEATGASSLSFEMMKYLGTNGIFIFTGVPGRKGPIEVDTDLIMRNLVLKNQVIFGTVNAGRESFENSIRDLATFTKRWPDAVKSLITGRFPMDAYSDGPDRPLRRSQKVRSGSETARLRGSLSGQKQTLPIRHVFAETANTKGATSVTPFAVCFGAPVG